MEYNDKFGRLAACQQMCTKFDRCAAQALMLAGLRGVACVPPVAQDGPLPLSGAMQVWPCMSIKVHVAQTSLHDTLTYSFWPPVEAGLEG